MGKWQSESSKVGSGTSVTAYAIVGSRSMATGKYDKFTVVFENTASYNTLTYKIEGSRQGNKDTTTAKYLITTADANPNTATEHVISDHHEYVVISVKDKNAGSQATYAAYITGKF